MFESKIHKLLMDGPDDVSALETLIEKGEVDPNDIKGIMLMHEGDGFARRFTSNAYASLLARKKRLPVDEILATVPIQAIAGLAGLMIPHAAVLVTREVNGKESGEKRMVAAGACTRRLRPEEYGSMTQVMEVANTVKALMKEVQIDDPKDVHFVFVKGPWANFKERQEAAARGKKLVSEDDVRIGQLSRGSGALGVAVALGEVKESQIADQDFFAIRDKVYSNIAHCSSGNERVSAAVILLGNTTKSKSNYVVGHGVLKDGLDGAGVKTILKDMGFKFDCCPSEKDLERIEYAFVKPKSAEVPTIRGYRHTLNTDPMMGPFRWNVEKSPVHAVVASVLGTPLIEVASGPENQGPPGCPLLAIVARA